MKIVNNEKELAKLNQYLQEAFEDYHHHKINAGDFDITLKKSNDKSLSINARMKSIFAEVPIAFTFAKSAGLYSIEGEGSIKINLEIQCEIDETFGFKTKSIMHNHSWYEGPLLHLGEFHSCRNHQQLCDRLYEGKSIGEIGQKIGRDRRYQKDDQRTA